MAGPAPKAFADPDPSGGPCLDAATRERLGRELQILYDPVLEEELDPRLAALLTQLDQDREAVRETRQLATRRRSRG